MIGGYLISFVHFFFGGGGGSHTLTFSSQSQRITDVVFKAFDACAASQGDCNNLTFGFGGNAAGEAETKGFGYYETIAGGSGAVRFF